MKLFNYFRVNDVSTVFIGGLMMVMCCAAQAAEPIHYGDSVPSAEKLIEQLTPKQAYKTRGISFGKPAPMTKPSVSMAVNFAHDSYALTPQAIEQLAPLGEALKSSELASFTFDIQGHTDATGTELYNLSLSEKRAIMVGSYLFKNYGIEPTRIQLTGKGEGDLFDKANPNSGLNRRVQISTLTSIEAE